MITLSTDILDNTSKKLSGNDADFFKRVWSQDLKKYELRLKAIGFENKEKVLDAGFGMGQWFITLGQLNKRAYGIEFSKERFNVVNDIVTFLKLDNLEIVQGTIEELLYEDNLFDAIFCYSVVLVTDFKRALKEFHRVLKPEGKLYFNTNGLGWYLYNLLEGHNSSSHFSSRQMAIDTIQNSISYYATGKNNPGQCIIMPKDLTLQFLKETGFSILAVDGEGKINLTKDIASISFFKDLYYDMEGVYEVLCQKI